MKRFLLAATLLTAIAFCTIKCSSKTDDLPLPPKTFVLVHGAWQAAYVWQDVKARLEAAGQKVIVVELPAHGSDTTPAVATSIDVYRDKVIAAINSTGEKVILVGHSMGGVVVTAVAEKIPEKIEKLIYIGAFVPANGQSILDLSMLDSQSKLGASLIPSGDQLTLDIKRDSIISIFCQDASLPIQQLVQSKFRVEPAIPFTNKATLTNDHYGKVDKYYIHTLQDHAIGINLQYQMATAAHITKTYSLNTGHCPFLTQPDSTAKLLLSIIQ